MEFWAHKVIGLLIAVVGSLPLFEIVQKAVISCGSHNIERRAIENPSGYLDGCSGYETDRNAVASHFNIA
jgi:hypothetical protein